MGCQPEEAVSISVTGSNGDLLQQHLQDLFYGFNLAFYFLEKEWTGPPRSRQSRVGVTDCPGVCRPQPALPDLRLYYPGRNRKMLEAHTGLAIFIYWDPEPLDLKCMEFLLPKQGTPSWDVLGLTLSWLGEASPCPCSHRKRSRSAAPRLTGARPGMCPSHSELCDLGQLHSLVPRSRN